MSESTVTRLFFNFFSKKSNAASTKYLSKFHTLAIILKKDCILNMSKENKEKWLSLSSSILSYV